MPIPGQVGCIRMVCRWLRPVLLFACWNAGAAADAPAPITRIADLRRLSREDAAKLLPARISGVVVWRDSAINDDAPADLIVNDGVNGLWVGSRAAREHGFWQGGVMRKEDTSPGAQVEIEGVSYPGGYAPIILPTRLKRTGTAPLPQAKRLPMERLHSGAEDGSQAVLEGVVQDVALVDGLTVSHLIADGHTCVLCTPRNVTLDEVKLVDARVRVRGVFTPVFNYRAEATGLKMMITGDDAFEILKPPPGDPFLGPPMPISHIMRFSPGTPPDHRKVTEGTVVFALPGDFFYLQDGESSIRVRSKDKSVMPGQRVEVAGFPDTRDNLTALKNALVRRLGTAVIPPPLPVTVAEILEPATAGIWTQTPPHRDLNGRAVRVRGRLMRVDWRSPGVPKFLGVESDGMGFSVRMPLFSALPPHQADTWQLGAEIEVAGICEMEFREGDINFFNPYGFRLWSSSPQDVRILRQPPWWTPQRTGIALGAVALALVAALAWVYSLRGQVAHRSRQLADEMSARQSAALEFDATLRERRRLANDLHDTLEHALTGLSLQLEIADHYHPDDPARSARHLHLARQFLDRSREEVHRTVWDLRTQGLGGRDILDVLRERAAAMVAGSSVVLSVEREGEPVAMPDLLAGNLLLLAQEAVTNALKHAAPGEISVRLRISSADTVILEVHDNGRGFDPATASGQQEGHFGLQGMHERAKRLGGTLEVESAPGQGTRIRMRMPLGGVELKK